MPTPKELSLRALQRTSKCLRESFAAFPAEHWRESPRGQANSLREVLGHLCGVEHWWRENLGWSDRSDWGTAQGEALAAATLAEVLEQFDAARDGLLQFLAEQPDAFFENPVPACQYGGLQTGADLCLYMGEHDFYHAGQVQMLEMAFTASQGATK
jgi:uncharacterized damage-inducible protein DinB